MEVILESDNMKLKKGIMKRDKKKHQIIKLSDKNILLSQ